VDVDVVRECGVPAAYRGAWEGTRYAQAGAVEALAGSTVGGGVMWEWGHQMTLVRCLFGNPFLPVSLDPASRTPAVVSLAQAAYDERILPAGTLDPPASPCWRTHSKMRVAPTPTSSHTCAGRGRMSGDAGRWTSSSASSSPPRCP